MMFRQKGGMSVVNFLVFVLVCMEYYVDSSQLVSGEVRCVEREREALLRFKNQLTDEYGVLSSWGSEDSKKECCKWMGVVCTDSNTNTSTTAHVISLQLGFDPMSGSPNVLQPMRGNISDALLELCHLTYLDLSFNYIDQLPQFIGSMKQLKHLNLQNCFLSGAVPPQLGNLTNLQTLDLSFNYALRSENLDWLSHLSSLTRLDLSYSFDLSQTSWWFPQILKLRSLQELHLSRSNISAIVPPFPFAKNNSSLTSLSILDLSNNKITSSKLDWLFNISSSLAEIDMSHNELDGLIPELFGEMIYLEHLDLSENMLEGVIPKSLGNLTRLRTLSLSNNEFRGDLEELFGNLCAKVKFSLERLYLSDNQLNGSLSELKAFPSLRKLYLGNNNFVGSMPRVLSQHSFLEELDVSFNLLEGTISEAYFTKRHNLKVLDLSFNRLTLRIAQDWIPPFQLDAINLGGCKMSPNNFPKWIQTQRNLSNLDLPYAGISDEVPKWLWSFSPALSHLNISHNYISGTIPHLSSTLLSYLDVGSNKLSGSLPLLPQTIYVVQLSQNMFSGPISSICSLPHVHIWILDLSDNQFSGELPNCWDKMSGLAYLNLGDNNFSGEIPLTLGTLEELNSLHLRGNNLYGDLPSTLRNCTELLFIDVEGNKLTGNIPAWTGENFFYLMYVILSQNKFHGSIPPEICNLTYIRVLDLSRNNISGEIPHCFSRFFSLTEKNTTIPIYGALFYFPQLYELLTQFEYTFLQWKGGEFEYRKIIQHLRLIDLSSNRLVGTIPESFSCMRELVSLNLSRNMLEGTIISRIGEMEMLEVLDLSRNKFSSHIPISLAQLHFLGVLDLANNSLSGEIPSSTQLQSFNAFVYGGNHELCGRPLKLCPEDVPDKQGKDMKEDGGSVSLSFMQGFIISIVMGFIVGFWGAVGSLILKSSWRYAYFNFFDEVKDWLCIKTALLFKASTPR